MSRRNTYAYYNATTPKRQNILKRIFLKFISYFK